MKQKTLFTAYAEEVYPIAGHRYIFVMYEGKTYVPVSTDRTLIQYLILAHQFCNPPDEFDREWRVKTLSRTEIKKLTKTQDFLLGGQDLGGREISGAMLINSIPAAWCGYANDDKRFAGKYQYEGKILVSNHKKEKP